MSASAKMKAHIVRISIEEGKTGLFFARSPDLRGLLVAEKTLGEVSEMIPQAITEMYAACGVHVVVSPVDQRANELQSWVAVPAEIAKRALGSKGSKGSKVA